MNKLKNKINEALAKGISRTDLADALMVSEGTVQRYQNGSIVPSELITIGMINSINCLLDYDPWIDEPLTSKEKLSLLNPDCWLDKEEEKDK
ncbi:MAG TPA: helix-turn-helix transcriptional regulator [Candidatus Glassbacteria bacterium]|nr:helix-turn-helix transcriptional regulator [Candidatus Glassbacteria bacterium]